MNFPSINLPDLTGDVKKDTTAVKTAFNDVLAKLNALGGSGSVGRSVVIAPITTGTPNYTYQLPAANGTHDITVMKVDTGTGLVVVTAAGNDKVGPTLSQTTFTLYKQGDSVRLVDVMGGWYPISIVSGWATYTPTFTGFGTPTSIDFWWSRQGGSLLIMGKFTSGTNTATEARISLPLSLISDATIVPSIRGCGDILQGSTGASSIYCLIESGVAYMTWGVQHATSSALTKRNGNDFGSTTVFAVKNVVIPISGWN